MLFVYPVPLSLRKARKTPTFTLECYTAGRMAALRFHCRDDTPLYLTRYIAVPVWIKYIGSVSHAVE